MHTTSRPRRRSNGSKGKRQSGPIKAISLRVKALAPKSWTEHSATMKGIAVEKKGAYLSFSIMADTPEEALAKLKILGELFSSKT